MENKPAAIMTVLAISETIREAKRIPSGTLYAALLGKMSLEVYNGIIKALKNARLVKEVSHELVWIGPNLR